MKKYYRIVDGRQESGIGEYVPDGFIVYENEPQELIDALALEKQEQEALKKIAEDKKSRSSTMLAGAVYNIEGKDYLISFTKDDGDGLTQVKSAFEIGLSATTIHFENGTKLPITSEEFLPFSLWFVNKRNEFFYEN